MDVWFVKSILRNYFTTSTISRHYVNGPGPLITDMIYVTRSKTEKLLQIISTKNIIMGVFLTERINSGLKYWIPRVSNFYFRKRSTI